MIQRVQARKRKTATRVQVFLVCALTVAIAGLWVQPAAANTAFASDDARIVLRQDGPGPFLAADVSLLSTSITVSGLPILTPSTNLIIHFVMQCELITSVLAQGSPTLAASTSQAAAGIGIWATVDGVPVFPPGTDTDFKAIACDRGHINTANLQAGESVRPILRNVSTVGFTWIAQNIGLGTHFVEVHGTLVANVTGVGGIAHVAVTKRVLAVWF